MSHTPQLRSWKDRLRQVFLFELFGLLLITPAFYWASGVPIVRSVVLLACLALIAAIWNGLFNTAFDWIEGSLIGRTADLRTWKMRVFQACCFEIGLFCLTWPLIVTWTGMDWMTAFWADIGLAIFYTAYAFIFNLAYDHFFPIMPANDSTK